MAAKQEENNIQPRVIGIGGIFFYAQQPEHISAWYAKNLGIDLNPWGGASFHSRDLNEKEKVQSLEWKPFTEGDSYFEPSNKPFMINYRVEQIEALVAQLHENGVKILDEITHYEGIGKFVHIMDEEGNKLELWESE